MALTRELQILLKVRDEASTQLAGLEKSVRSLQPAFKTMAVAGGAAFTAVSAFAATAIASAQEAEKVQAQLNATLASTKGVAGVTKDMALELASAMQKQTTYNDEAVLSAENLLLTFTNISKDVFPDTLQAVLDMSTALGQDLKSSAIQVGKALQDPILGVSALRRVGVNFTEAQQEVIKTMVESGRTMEAQRYILRELNTEFGGSAAAQAQTYAGKMQQLNNQLDDVKETIGMALIPVLSDLLKQVVPVVERFAQWAQENPETIKNIVLVGGALSGVVATVGTLGLLLPPVIAGVKGLAAAFMYIATSPGLIALTAAAAALIAVYESYLKTKRELDAAAASGAVTRDLALKTAKTLDTIKDPAARASREKLISDSMAAADETDRLASLGFLGMVGEGFKGLLPSGRPLTAGSGIMGTPTGSPTYNFTFNGDVMDQQKLVSQVTAALDRQNTLKFKGGI